MGGVMVLAFLSWMPESTWNRLRGTVVNYGTLDESSTLRLSMYRAALDVFGDYPVGAGTGQVNAAMGSAYGRRNDPHNGFLMTICEYGPVGLAALLAALLGFARSASRVLRAHDVDPLYRSYALGMRGLLVGLCVCNLFYSNFYRENVLPVLALHFGMLSSAEALASQGPIAGPAAFGRAERLASVPGDGRVASERL